VGSAVSALGTAARAGELAGVTLPDTLKAAEKTVKLNGLGLRKEVVFKVYVGGLYLESPSKDAAAILSADQAKAIRMPFVRDLPKAQLVEAFQEGFEANVKDWASLKAAFDRMLALLPDVKEGGTLTFTYLPGKGTTLSARSTELSVFEGKGFADAVFALWLGPKPPSEDLKRGCDQACCAVQTWSPSAGRARQQEVVPADPCDAGSLGRDLSRRVAHEERPILREAAGELHEAAQVGRPDRAGFDLHRPAPPRSIQDAVDFEGLLAPVSHALAGIPGVGQARILDPRAEASRVAGGLRRARRVGGGEERLVQHHQLGRGRPTPEGSAGMLRQRGDQESLLQQGQVVRDRLERSALHEMPLDLLERDHLGRGRHADAKDLPEESRLADWAER